MILEVVVQANSDKVNIRVPQVDLQTEFSNVVAYIPSQHFRIGLIERILNAGSSSEFIVSIGETEASKLQQNLVRVGEGSRWEKVKSHIRFVSPFDTQQFHPAFAGRVLFYYAWGALCSKARTGIRAFWPFDRFDYKLWIEGYEAMAADIQAEFEYILYRDSKVRQATINGQTVKQGQYKLADWTLRLFICVMLAGVGLAILALIPAESRTATIPHQQVLVVGLVTVIGSIPIIYSILFLGVALWLIVMRNFLSPSILRCFLPAIGLPKAVSNWLVSKVNV